MWDLEEEDPLVRTHTADRPARKLTSILIFQSVLFQRDFLKKILNTLKKVIYKVELLFFFFLLYVGVYWKHREVVRTLATRWFSPP